jgi:hypothetical protein
MGDLDLKEDLDAFSHALRMGFPAEIFIGKKLYCEEERENLMALMKKYPDTFDVYIMDAPHDKVSLQGNLLVIPDYHPRDKPYEFATSISLNDDVLNEVQIRLEKLRDASKKASISDIERVGIH